LLREHCATWAQEELFPTIGKEPKADCHRFVTENGESFTVMALSRPMKRNPNAALSVMIGFEETSAFQRKVGFAQDTSLPSTIMAQDEKKLKSEAEFRQIQDAMQRLMENEKAAVSELTEQ
jgi:hypothetical protein